MAKGKAESEKVGMEAHHIVMVPNEAWEGLETHAEARGMGVQEYVSWVISMGVEKPEEVDLYIHETRVKAARRGR